MSLAPPKPTVVFAPGDKLDRYELICPIAEGGMGICWLARMQGKHGFEKLVAIKTMRPQYSLDPIFQRMFVDEARIAARIEHPNVAAIYDIGDNEGGLYLAMEYVDGDALSSVLREITKLSIAIPHGIALRILADTCGALHAAHELCDASRNPMNVVHRDVSPQNILVNVKGAAKLIDFGIAKARDRTSGDTSAGTIKGKIHYMAPEQALGRGDIDRRADVFSVGAILYQLCSGRRAFQAESEVATILMLASGRPPLPLPKAVAPAVAAVVMRALDHDRARRFQTASEAQSAIEEAMVSAGLTTTQATVAEFIAQHLGHRAHSRKKAIDVALSKLALASERAVIRAGEDKPSTGAVHGSPLDVRDVAVLALNTDVVSSPTLSAASLSDLPSNGGTRGTSSRRRLGRTAALVVLPVLALVGVVAGVATLRSNSESSLGAATGPEKPLAIPASTPAASVVHDVVSPGAPSAPVGSNTSAKVPPDAALAASGQTKNADASARPRVAAATATAPPVASAPAKRKKVVDDLTIHPFSSSSAARNAAIASAPARSLASPREIVMVPGGPPEDLPV